MTNDIRWNDFANVQPVQFEDELSPRHRQVRLSSPAARTGDQVKVRDDGTEVQAVIVAIVHSTLHVRRVK